MSILIVRLGDNSSTAYGADAAFPVYLDEVDVWSGAVLRSTALQSVASEASPACTLGRGSTRREWNYATDGLPSNSEDMKLALLPCFNISAGSRMTMMSSKTIAQLSSDAHATNSAPLYPYMDELGPTGFRQVASVDGTSFWMAGASADHWGFRFADSVNARTTVFVQGEFSGPGQHDARSVTVHDGVLYGSAGPVDVGFSSVFAVSAVTALPETAVADPARLLSGLPANLSCWTFTFETNASLWISVDDVPGWPGAVHHYALVDGSAWVLQRTVMLDATAAVYSITGRAEAGGFALYAASSVGVYRYDASTDSTHVVATPGAARYFRGVAIPPL